MSKGMLGYLGVLLGGGQNNTPTGGDDEMIVNVTYDSETQQWSADKTAIEVIAAINGGKSAIAKVQDVEAPVGDAYFMLCLWSVFINEGYNEVLFMNSTIEPDNYQQVSYYDYSMSTVDLISVGGENSCYVNVGSVAKLAPYVAHE